MSNCHFKYRKSVNFPQLFVNHVVSQTNRAPTNDRLNCSIRVPWENNDKIHDYKVQIKLCRKEINSHQQYDIPKELRAVEILRSKEISTYYRANIISWSSLLSRLVNRTSYDLSRARYLLDSFLRERKKKRAKKGREGRRKQAPILRKSRKNVGSSSRAAISRAACSCSIHYSWDWPVSRSRSRVRAFPASVSRQGTLLRTETPTELRRSSVHEISLTSSATGPFNDRLVSPWHAQSADQN